MRNKKLLLGGLLLLGIGFAAVSTTLILTGNVTIATNDADFDVRFTKAVLDGTDISTDAISPDGKTITFGTKELTTVGDKSILDFEVTNNSEMYDAEVSVVCTAEGTKKNYYEIISSVKSPIVGKTTGTGNVQVKLLKASIDDIREKFTCTLTAIAKERTTKAELPIYYAFGDPLTAADRTIEYETLKCPGTDTPAKVFVKLDADGQKSVCTLATGSLECFKNDNWEKEKTHITEVFSDFTCETDDTMIACGTSTFSCAVTSDGVACCDDVATDSVCYVFSDGVAYCE